MTRRLGVAVAAAAALLCLCGTGRWLTGCDTTTGRAAGRPPQPTPAHTGSSTARTAGAAPAAPDDGPAATPSTPTEPDPRPAATRFAHTWASHPHSAAAWHTALAATATPALRGKLAAVDPDQVPARAITGPATTVQVGDRWAQVAVPTDTGRLELGLLLTGRTWRADTIDWTPA